MLLEEHRIGGSESLNINKISNEFGVEKSNIRGILQLLFSLGYLEKSETSVGLCDGRVFAKPGD